MKLSGRWGFATVSEPNSLPARDWGIKKKSALSNYAKDRAAHSQTNQQQPNDSLLQSPRSMFKQLPFQVPCASSKARKLDAAPPTLFSPSLDGWREPARSGAAPLLWAASFSRQTREIHGAVLLGALKLHQTSADHRKIRQIRASRGNVRRFVWSPGFREGDGRAARLSLQHHR